MINNEFGGPSQLDIAQNYLAADQYALALSQVSEYLSQHPNSVDGLLIASEALSGLERYADALGAAQRAVALAPEYPYALLQFASCAGLTGRFYEAIDAVRRVIQLDPQDWAGHVTLAEMITMHAEQHGKKSELGVLQLEALRHAEIARSLGPDIPGSHVVLGYCLADLERLPEAKASFAEALRLDPENSPARAGIAYVELKSGETSSAAAANIGLLRDDPTSKVAELNLTASVLTALQIAMAAGFVVAWLFIRIFRNLNVTDSPQYSTPNFLLAAGAVVAGIWFAFSVRQFLKKAGRGAGAFIRRNKLVLVAAGAFAAMLVGLLITAALPVSQMMMGIYIAVLPTYLVTAVSWVALRVQHKKRFKALNSGG